MSGSPPGNRFLFHGSLLAWLAAVACGMAWTWHYARTPGATPLENAPALRPGAVSAGPWLALFLHPHCPCSRATLEELLAVITADRELQATVYFLQPEGHDTAWVEGALWKKAGSLPRVETVCDPGGVMAKKFGAVTSGHAVLYSREGRRLFEGGLTGARGHAGWNAGREAVLSLAAGRPATVHSTPVYGCALY